MKRALFLLTFSLLIFSVTDAVAATGSILGMVKNEEGKAITDASVMLLRAADSSLIKIEITDEKGEYRLTLVNDGQYIVHVTSVGYAQFSSPSVNIVGDDYHMPDIVLNTERANLKEVAVRSQKQYVEVHADKLVVNVDNSIVNTGSSVLDVIARSPGVTVDQNDNISLKGKQGVTIMIDGKIQPLSGGDLANMLKSMPSTLVDKIELISNPSAKYDAAGTAGIINIKTKKDSKAGFNGSVTTTYAQGVYPKGIIGFNMNYRNKKFNFFTNGNLSERKGFTTLTLDRQFFNNNNFAGEYRQQDNYIYHFNTYIAGAGVDYGVSSKTVLGVVLGAEYGLITRDAVNYSDNVDSATRQTTTRFITQNTSPTYWGSYTANLNLRHTFDTTGKALTVDADYASYPSHGTQDYTTTYYDIMPDGSSVVSPAIPVGQRHGDLHGVTDIRSLKADYVNPLKNNAKLEAGFKTSYVTADNEPKFYNIIGGNRVLDVSSSDHFIYKENINAAYVNCAKDWTKWSTQLGFRVEQTIAKGDNKTIDSSFDRNYAQLFPSFAVQRHVNKDNDLGITLSRRIERPNYEQLNPFKYFLDPSTYKEGYPYLQPALSYSAELSHTFRQKFITTLSYVITTNPIIEVLQPSETENKITIQTTKNLTSMQYLGVSGSYQLQFFKWWNNTTNCNAYYALYKGDIAGSDLNSGKATFDIYTTNSFMLPHNISAELSYYYQAPQVYGYMNLKPQSMLSGGIQKSMFDKRVTLKLNITDIFWKGYPIASSIYNSYSEFFIAKRDTRQASISLTYRFGKKSVPAIRKHSGGAEDEMKRAGQTG